MEMCIRDRDNYHVAQANEALDAEGHFVRNSVSGRYLDETQAVSYTHLDGSRSFFYAFF